LFLNSIYTIEATAYSWRILQIGKRVFDFFTVQDLNLLKLN